MARRVIGIDLGHCETAAALSGRNLVDGKTVNEAKTLVTNQGNVQVMPTQIILTNDQMRKLKGNMRPDYALLSSIGPFETGDLRAYVENGERFFYFKAIPAEFDQVCARTETGKDCGITHGMVMACFVYAVVENIFKYNFTEMNEGDRPESTLLIGCPTTGDWTDDWARKEYEKLVQAATGVQEVRIIPESRAAMFSSVDSGVNKTSAANGAVVFDFGSSTADCTYMLLGRKIIEFSWALGASEIERQMTREALLAAAEEFGPFMPTPASVADSDAEFRKHKEAHYDGKYPPRGKPINCEFVNSANGEMLDSMVRVDRKFMDKVTGENTFTIVCDSVDHRTGSWQQLCLEFFKEAKKRIESATCISVNAQGVAEEVHCSVDTVVLTGGASKMDFIHSLCCDVFTDPEVKIELNTVSPSHTVSNGLAWVAIADENLESCKKQAKKAVIDDKNCGKSALKKMVSDAMFEELYDFLMQEVTAWANAPGDNMTVKQLQTRLDSVANSPAVRSTLETACDKAVTEWKKNLSDSMERAINAQVANLYSRSVAASLVIPRDVWASLNAGALDLNSIRMDGVFRNLNMNSLGRETALIVKRVLIWGVAIALAPETLFLSLVGGLLLDAFMDGMISDEDLNRPRAQNLRKRIAASMRKKLSEQKSDIMKGIDKELDDQMKSYEDTVDAMLDVAFKIVTLQKFEVE